MLKTRILHICGQSYIWIFELCNRKKDIKKKKQNFATVAYHKKGILALRMFERLCFLYKCLKVQSFVSEGMHLGN